MTLTQLSRWENLTRIHPLPWVLEQCNNKQACIKDGKGNDVYFEDFGGIPDEMSSADRTSIIEGGRALALFLVAISDNPYAKPAL